MMYYKAYNSKQNFEYNNILLKLPNFEFLTKLNGWKILPKKIPDTKILCRKFSPIKVCADEKYNIGLS